MSKGMGTGVATGMTTGTMAGRAETATGRVPLWQPARMKPVARIARHLNRIRESFWSAQIKSLAKKEWPIPFLLRLYSRDDPQLTGARTISEKEPKKQQLP